MAIAPPRRKRRDDTGDLTERCLVTAAFPCNRVSVAAVPRECHRMTSGCKRKLEHSTDIPAKDGTTTINRRLRCPYPPSVHHHGRV
jgi:hypothetical protein